MKRTLLHFIEKFKKPLHIFTAFAVIICTAFSVPAFAVSSVFVNPLPITTSSTSDIINNGSYIGDSQGGNKHWFTSSSVDNIFYIGVNASSGSGYNYYVTELNSDFTIYYCDQNGNSYNTITYNSAWEFSETYNLYYLVRNIITSNYQYNDYNFTSLDDGLSFVRNFLDNNNSSNNVWVNKPLVIPQGYTAVINTTNMTAGKGGFRLRANTGNLGNSNLWRDIFGNDNIQSGQAIYNTNTPVTSYDFDDYPQLTWSPYEYSLLRATAYEYIGEATKSNTYTYIFNPIQGNATSIKNGQNTNSYITLYMNDQFDGTVKLYPLTSMAAVGQGQTIDVGNDESENAGSGDISNGTWTNSDGNVFTPPQGGGNGTGSSQNSLEAIAGTVEHLGEVLNQFVGGLSTILTTPVEAIQTLINNGSAFVSHLSGLYSWLPAQVYSTLTSAIILCITVGVLKVLL